MAEIRFEHEIRADALRLARMWVAHAPGCNEHNGPMFACTCAWLTRTVEMGRAIEEFYSRWSSIAASDPRAPRSHDEQ